MYWPASAALGRLPREGCRAGCRDASTGRCGTPRRRSSARRAITLGKVLLMPFREAPGIGSARPLCPHKGNPVEVVLI